MLDDAKVWIHINNQKTKGYEKIFNLERCTKLTGSFNGDLEVDVTPFGVILTFFNTDPCFMAEMYNGIKTYWVKSRLKMM